MTRRSFIKLSMVTYLSLVVPKIISVRTPGKTVSFDFKEDYNENMARWFKTWVDYHDKQENTLLHISTPSGKRTPYRDIAEHQLNFLEEVKEKGYVSTSLEPHQELDMDLFTCKNWRL